MEGIGTGGDSYGKTGTAIQGDLFFKGRNILAQNVMARINNPSNDRIKRGLDGFILARKVKKWDRHIFEL